MLHYETRTDTWYLNGHAVDPYEDFAAILRASEEPTAIEDQEDIRTKSEQVADRADDELHRAIVREAMMRVWSSESVDRVIRACLLPPTRR